MRVVQVAHAFYLHNDFFVTDEIRHKDRLQLMVLVFQFQSKLRPKLTCFFGQFNFQTRLMYHFQKPADQLSSGSDDCVDFLKTISATVNSWCLRRSIPSDITNRLSDFHFFYQFQWLPIIVSIDLEKERSARKKMRGSITATATTLEEQNPLRNPEFRCVKYSDTIGSFILE